VRGVLGIPAYLVSALLGSSRWEVGEVEESKAGLPLRVLAAAASVATIVGVVMHI
jgi:hypothetical protein